MRKCRKRWGLIAGDLVGCTQGVCTGGRLEESGLRAVLSRVVFVLSECQGAEDFVPAKRLLTTSLVYHIEGASPHPCRFRFRFRFRLHLHLHSPNHSPCHLPPPRHQHRWQSSFFPLVISPSPIASPIASSTWSSPPPLNLLACPHEVGGVDCSPPRLATGNRELIIRRKVRWGRWWRISSSLHLFTANTIINTIITSAINSNSWQFLRVNLYNACSLHFLSHYHRLLIRLLLRVVVVCVCALPHNRPHEGGWEGLPLLLHQIPTHLALIALLECLLLPVGTGDQSQNDGTNEVSQYIPLHLIPIKLLAYRLIKLDQIISFIHSTNHHGLTRSVGSVRERERAIVRDWEKRDWLDVIKFFYDI